MKRGDWTDPALGKITVGEWSKLWLAGLEVTPKTRHGYDERLRSLILPRWQDTRLNAVMLSEVKAWVATMAGARGRSASDTRRRDAGAQLVRMLDAAVDEGLIRSNPAKTKAGKTTYLPRAKKAKSHRYLSDNELLAVADECGSYGSFVLLAGYTGLRWGEITALRVRDVNLLHGRITVERAHSMVGGRLLVGDTKTHERRQVVVPGFLREDLSRLMVDRDRDDLIFVSPDGSPLDNRNFSQRVLAKAWVRAGVERLTFHDLRHTAASLAVASGANVMAVQRMLGHASAAMTLDTYAGLFDDHLVDVADRMSERAMSSRAHSVPTRGTEQVTALRA
ncbi:tyrosine-type recombinase/integrase [Angustibacter luteus]|uniref:Tyrosine-type recombinase/integrase n=1 Tax=Angustibacter luteus TaxID=658456 RepID=A0ABW1JEH3_9ACTN